MKKFIIIALAAAMILVSFVGCSDEPETPKDPSYFPGFTPDYPAPPVEGGAEDIEGGSNEKLEAPEGGGAVGLIYSKDVTIDLSDKSIQLYFGNPKKSVQNMTLQLVIQGKVVMESGLLEPGKRLSFAELSDEMAAVLTPGVYNEGAKFLIRFYNPGSNECSIFQSEIDLAVTVKE